jgi:hypothetical protein
MTEKAWKQGIAIPMILGKLLCGQHQSLPLIETLRDSSRLRVFVVDRTRLLPRRREDAKKRQVFG